MKLDSKNYGMEKSSFQYCQMNPHLDCYYTFPIDLPTNGIHFGNKSIRKV